MNTQPAIRQPENPSHNGPFLSSFAGALVGMLLILSVQAAPGALAVEDDVEGLWATGGSLVEVSRDGSTLQMIVVALEHPFDDEGQPFLDTENPDKTLRTQTILGSNLLSNYAFNGKYWEGKIYDPESGKVYSSRMKLKSGKLEMRGYIGTPLLGKTKKFKPISSCQPDMLVMLKNSSITGYCGL